MTDESHRAAVEAGYAPLSDYVADQTAATELQKQIETAFPAAVFIPDDVWQEFESYAKRTGCDTETAILAALNQWLGRV